MQKPEKIIDDFTSFTRISNYSKLEDILPRLQEIYSNHPEAMIGIDEEGDISVFQEGEHENPNYEAELKAYEQFKAKEKFRPKVTANEPTFENLEFFIKYEQEKLPNKDVKIWVAKFKFEMPDNFPKLKPYFECFGKDFHQGKALANFKKSFNDTRAEVIEATLKELVSR